MKKHLFRKAPRTVSDGAPVNRLWRQPHRRVAASGKDKC